MIQEKKRKENIEKQKYIRRNPVGGQERENEKPEEVMNLGKERKEYMRASMR